MFICFLIWSHCQTAYNLYLHALKYWRYSLWSLGTSIFSQYFKINYPCYYKRLSFLHFSDYILLCYVNNTISWFILLTKNSECFQFFNITNNAIMNILVHISLGTCGHFSGKCINNCWVIIYVPLPFH